MELVEGETLAERLSRGALPVEEALPIAIQIAEALEAAHEKGVVHRDLKPANVKITPDGQVKVLDFGLAKVMEKEATSGSAANSPTLSMMATQAGLILGTAAYMSPEQAKGFPADHRSDIFSFGVGALRNADGPPAVPRRYGTGRFWRRSSPASPTPARVPARYQPAAASNSSSAASRRIPRSAGRRSATSARSSKRSLRPRARLRCLQRPSTKAALETCRFRLRSSGPRLRRSRPARRGRVKPQPAPAGLPILYRVACRATLHGRPAVRCSIVSQIGDRIAYVANNQPLRPPYIGG